MAVVVFSPWPAESATVTRRAALNALRKALSEGGTTAQGNAFDDKDLELERVASTVSARVESYAPDAPQQNRNEAVVRGVAWLNDTRGAERERGAGSIQIEPAPVNTASWFLHSGAAALLTRWKVRRGGAC